MNRLKEYYLSDLYIMDSGISTKPEQAGHGYPFISFSDIFNNEILPFKLKEKMDTSEEERNKYSVKKGDILLTRTSETLDELAMTSVALKDYKNTTFSGFAKRLRPIQKDITYDKYMAFYMRSNYFRKIIDYKAIMTLRASFNDAIFSYIKILLPEYQEQVKIGNLLYEIQKKIDNNNLINDELEKIINLLYNRWFLQFDFPNVEGKPYFTNNGEMIFNNKINKKIPANWSVKKLTDISTFINGFPFSTNLYSENGKYKLYTIKNVQNDGIVSKVDNKVKQLPNKMDEECLLKKGDIIMSLTGNVGRVGIVYEENALLNQRILKIKPINNMGYLYSFLKDKNTQKKCEKIARGTSQKNLSPVEFGNSYVAYPDKITLEKYENIIVDYLNMIINNKSENENLTALKKYLLPMLMNGQVTFKE